MADYIIREAAGNGIYSCPTKTDADGYIWVRTKDVAHMIDEIPAADVVEVVRCKDCRFYYKDSDGYEMCDASEGYDHISADGFCAWAKRRTDND